MLNIKKNTTIYVACPYEVVTGGTESLHQLVYELNRQECNAYIFYFDIKRKAEVPISSKFKKYITNYVSEINDASYNVIVIPEVQTQLLHKYKNIQKCIWWLSLDFFFKTSPKQIAISIADEKNINNLLRPIFLFLKTIHIKIKTKKFKILNIEKKEEINRYFHIYNSEYARLFLVSKGVNKENMNYLCGPISEDYLNCNLSDLSKENIIIYNPAKGYEFTRKIINYILENHNDILFIPIAKMVPKQISLLLKKAKVYIDFGFFPGPERIPREAVASFCNLVTSSKGSAMNDVDVLIPREYKFDIEKDDIENIGKKVLEVLYNYDKHVKNYNDYRKKVYDQSNLLIKNINVIFNKK